MTAFAPLEWHDFFLASVGASAALTGLLFVTLSMNLQHILKHPRLPGRAAGTLGVLLSVLIATTFGLVPGQSVKALGAEIGLTGFAVACQAVLVSWGKGAPGDPLRWTVEQVTLLLIPGLVFIAGGVSLLVGGGGGLYWVLAATVLAFLTASINAWVLLVEILR